MEQGDALFMRLRESYAEVLDATKHQDDKIGRFIGGIAFLTGAALVFLNQVNVLQVRFDIAGVMVRLPALAIVGFLLAIIWSLLLYLVASSAPLTVPGGLSGARSSHIFFLLIAGESDESWRRLWSAQDLTQELIPEYRREILNLAQRAQAKYRRAQQATAMFIAALVLFGLAAVATIAYLATSPAGDPPELPTLLGWGSGIRFATAMLLAGVVFILLYQQHESGRFVATVVKKKTKKQDGDGNPNSPLGLLAEPRLWALRGLMVAAPLLQGLLVWPSAAAGWQWAVVSGGVGLVATLSVYTLVRAPDGVMSWVPLRFTGGGRRYSRTLVLLIGLVVVLLCVIAFKNRALMLAVAVALTMAPLLVTLWSPHSERRRHLARHDRSGAH